MKDNIFAGKFFYFIAFLTLLVLLPSNAQAAPPLFWAEDPMTWVYKNAPAKNNMSIVLYTAKNEYEPFQVVVQAPPTNTLTNINITISDLIGSGGSVNRNNITLYREHYLYVTRGSKVRPGDTNSPLGPGWYPDGLIPFVDPATGQDLQGALDAVPFTLPAGENQPIWVDIFTPGTTIPGTYTGTATITSNEGTATVQIILYVWNFSLPKTRSLKGYTNTFGQYRSTVNAEELLRHRINPKIVSRSDERFLIDTYALDTIHVFRESGASYGNCTASPAPSVSEVTVEAAAHEPGLYLLTSYANEVWDCLTLFPAFLDWSKNLRQSGIHPMIVTYPVDALIIPDINNTAGDVWSILPKHYDQAKIHIDRLVNQPTIQAWSYNPLVQDGFSPKFTIDFTPVNARIMQGFINQSIGFKGTKFWRVDNWTANPWNNAEASRADAPGEGHMAYPGDTVGLPGRIIPGVRLKMHREGSEDFEYIQMLKDRGDGLFALATARTVGVDFRTWSPDKNVLFAARKALGDRLSGFIAAGAPTNTPPLFPTVTPLATITPAATLIPVPTSLVCDQCGYCIGDTVPSDYAACVSCIYGTGGNSSVPDTQSSLPTRQGFHWTVAGCVETNIGGFTTQSIRFFVGIVSGITFLIMLYGGFLILTSQGDSQKLYTGKKLLTSAVVTELIVLFATFLFNQAGNTILRIPGPG